MNTDSFHRIYAAVKRYLTAYEKCVVEGSRVEEANCFATFICSSGICSLLRDNPESNAQLAEWMPYNGSELWDDSNRLRQMCQEYWRGRGVNKEGTAQGLPLAYHVNASEKMDAMFKMIEQAAQKKTRKKLPAKAVKLLSDAPGGAA